MVAFTTVTASALAATPLPPVLGSGPERRVGAPKRYTREQTFASERARVAFVVNHLTSPTCASFRAFATELRKVFGEPHLRPNTTGGLLNISQGKRTAQDYALDLRTKDALSDWNEPAQWSCPLDLPSPQPCSRPWLMSMSTMFKPSFDTFWRTRSLSRLRSASSTLLPSPSWGSLWEREACR